MPWYFSDDKREAKARTARQILQRRKKGEVLLAVMPKVKIGISATFWGKAWNRNLEAYSDYANRLPRGRTYLRQGSVMDLDIAKGIVTSTVQGSELYEVQITIQALSASRWASLKQECAGRIGSLVELLGGKLSDDIMAYVSDKKDGIFPSPREIQISCSCPDYADLCKHAAATLYAVSCRLDDEPGLLFTLRGVDAAELIGTSTLGAVKALTEVTETGAEGLLGDADLADVFGISFNSFDFPEPEVPSTTGKPSSTNKLTGKAAKKIVMRKTAAKKATSKKSAKKVPAKAAKKAIKKSRKA